MRQVVARRAGGPEVLETVDVPEPAAGPGEVVVRTEAIGVKLRGRVPGSSATRSRRGSTASSRSSAPRRPTHASTPARTWERSCSCRSQRSQ